MKQSFRWPVFKEEETGRVYDHHLWTPREAVLEGVKCLGISALFAWFFYRSVWAFFPLCLVGAALWQRDERKRMEEDRRALVLQFRDCIRCADTAMKAGYSVENAFLETLPDMRLMHGESAAICRELERIHRGIVMNVTLEELFRDLGRRSQAAQIREFAEILAVAKRSGGSFPSMIRTSAEIIHQKVEAEEEVRTQTASKRMEQWIMNIMPFGIVMYLEISNPGYFDMLFHNFQGIGIMTGCLAIYLGSCFLSEKILRKAMSVWE